MKLLNYFFSEANKKQVVLTILCLAFTVRIVVCFSIGSELKWYDENNYHSIAVSISNGDGFQSTYNPYSTNRWAPLQGYILAGIYKLAGESPAAARFIQDMFAVCCCYLIFWIGYNIFNYVVGLISLMIFSIHPLFVFVANLIYPESNFSLFLLLVIIGVLLGIRDRKVKYFIFAGIFWGLALLQKPVAIFIAPVFPIVLFFSKKFNFSRILLIYTLIGLVACVVISPWILHNYKKYNKLYFITTEGAYSLISGNNPYYTSEDRKKSELPAELDGKFENLTEDEKVDKYTKESINFILTQPLVFLKNYSLRFINFWRFYPDTISKNKFTSKRNTIISAIFYLFLLPFSFFGMILGLKEWRKNLIFYGFIFSFAFGYSLFITTIRYRLPIEPYLIIFAAVGISHLLFKVGGKRIDAFKKFSTY